MRSTMTLRFRIKELVVWWIASSLSVAGGSAARGPRLVEAVREGDRAAVSLLLKEAPAEVNAPQADGATALAWAVHKDDLETASLLIDAGADVNAGNIYGVTPLSLACTNRNTLLVEMLLKAGADPNSPQVTGETPLMSCVRTGSTAGAKALLLYGADANAKDNERGQTALMWAAEGRPAIVQMLVEHGASLNARSARLALYTPKVPNPAQVSPTGIQVHQGFRKTVYFPKFKGGFTPLMFAAQYGDSESVRVLLAAGAEVDEGTSEGGTPLVVASVNGRENAALLLLEKGANPNKTDCYGMTALHWALQDGVTAISGGPTVTDRFWLHPKMPALVKALLAAGANPNARIAKDFMTYHVHRFSRGTMLEPPQVGQAGATPFLLAAAAGDAATMRVLLKAGADPKIATFEGTTPLMVAAGTGVQLETRGAKDDGIPKERRMEALEAVRLAWQSGLDVNAVSESGRTALHGASFYGLAEVIEFLAENGANLEAKDMYGQSAVSIALADPDGFIYRNLDDKGQDSTFHRRATPDMKTVELLLKLGAAPYKLVGRDLRGY